MKKIKRLNERELRKRFIELNKEKLSFCKFYFALSMFGIIMGLFFLIFLFKQNFFPLWAYITVLISSVSLFPLSFSLMSESNEKIKKLNSEIEANKI